MQNDEMLIPTKIVNQLNDKIVFFTHRIKGSHFL